MKGYCAKKVASKTSFDSRSFRLITRGKNRILIGCPKGKWKPKAQRCTVGTRAYEVLKPCKRSLSGPVDRLTDLHRQGFMKIKKPKKPKVPPPMVACDYCMNWHPKNKHTRPGRPPRGNKQRIINP